jgi:hypothetical protein
MEEYVIINKKNTSIGIERKKLFYRINPSHMKNIPQIIFISIGMEKFLNVTKKFFLSILSSISRC